MRQYLTYRVGGAGRNQPNWEICWKFIQTFIYLWVNGASLFLVLFQGNRPIGRQVFLKGCLFWLAFRKFVRIWWNSSNMSNTKGISPGSNEICLYSVYKIIRFYTVYLVYKMFGFSCTRYTTWSEAHLEGDDVDKVSTMLGELHHPATHCNIRCCLAYISPISFR